MTRVDRLNELLHNELAQLVQRQVRLEGALITITNVSCAPDLSQAKISVSILPDKYFGTALQQLRNKSNAWRKTLGKKLALYRLPQFIWQADTTEKRAAELEGILKQIA